MPKAATAVFGILFGGRESPIREFDQLRERCERDAGRDRRSSDRHIPPTSTNANGSLPE